MSKESKTNVSLKTPHETLVNCSKIEQDNEKNIYSKSPYEPYTKLKPNNKGKVGENFIREICNDKIKFNCEGTKVGTYDMILNDKRIEIKTSCMGTKIKSFQHENLRNDSCDFYIFINILPVYFYVTILPKFDLLKKNQIIKTTPHLRKGTSDVFKFTFHEKHIIDAIELGYSIKINTKTTIKEIRKFITRII
jgi:hypothetical protein